jgi:hypothetical protein
MTQWHLSSMTLKVIHSVLIELNSADFETRHLEARERTAYWCIEIGISSYARCTVKPFAASGKDAGPPPLSLASSPAPPSVWATTAYRGPVGLAAQRASWSIPTAVEKFRRAAAD